MPLHLRFASLSWFIAGFLASQISDDALGTLDQHEPFPVPRSFSEAGSGLSGCGLVPDKMRSAPKAPKIIKKGDLIWVIETDFPKPTLFDTADLLAAAPLFSGSAKHAR